MKLTTACKDYPDLTIPPGGQKARTARINRAPGGEKQRPPDNPGSDHVALSVRERQHLQRVGGAQRVGAVDPGKGLSDYCVLRID